MSKDINIDLSTLKSKLQGLLGWFGKYRVFLFFLLLSVIYGFLIFRINTLNSAQPDPASVTIKKQSFNNAHIDQSTIDKIKQLKDNSVNVQQLFDPTRQNPFQE